MNCPIDGAELKMADRQGIEIDYCPTCRGVWLDRGELDKLIERSAAELMPVGRGARYDEPRYREDEPRYRGREHGGHYKKKKKNWLGDLFEFGD